jgi:hypothetical protein
VLLGYWGGSPSLYCAFLVYEVQDEGKASLLPAQLLESCGLTAFMGLAESKMSRDGLKS